MTRPIVIAGAGIGGLTAGIALRQRGFTVRVLERAAALDPVGAGITVQVNAMRVMQRLGIADAIAAAGATVESGAIRRADGRVLRAMNQLDLVREYGAPFVAIHRARLQDVLLTAFGAEHLVTGAAVTEVTTGADGATVKLADGTSHDAAIVVGADGLRSTVRAALFGPEPLRAAEQIAWRGICPRSAAAGDPGGESWGRAARFGFVAINDREVYWYAAIDSAVSPPEQADQHAAMMDFYRGWHAPIPDLLRTTDPGTGDPHRALRSRPHRYLGPRCRDAPRRRRASHDAEPRPGRLPSDRGRLGARARARARRRRRQASGATRRHASRARSASSTSRGASARSRSRRTRC